MLQLENELGSAGCKGDDLARGSASVEENTKPVIEWKRSYAGDDIVLTAKVDEALLQDVSDTVLTLRHDGMIGRAYWNGALISDHAYGKFLPWEIGLAGAVRGEGELKIVCQSAAYCYVDTAVQAEKEITFAK